ncbi:MAG: C-terminal binding protein [Chloroflexi bacterium]|nr:C-terminal binding protein [Chloroflexota bacterium]
MYTIVYAFDDFDMDVEKSVLSALPHQLIPSHGLESAASREILHDADALMVTLQRVTAEVLDAMPKCKLVSRLGVGLDSIDLKAAEERGVWVANVPDYGIDEVSTHAMALLLAQLRGVVPLVASTRGGAWDASPAKPIRRFRGQTVGVLGFGRIGRAFAAKALGFGVRVIAHDAFVSAEDMRAVGVESVSLDDLFRQSDFISLHAPLTEESKHVVNARTLALMKPGAYLVNTARGGLVDEAALLEAIRGGQLRGAALDVLTSEPPRADDAALQGLLQDPRVLITPHVAWYSDDAMIDMRSKGADEVVRVLSGNTPRCPVNRPVGK